MKFERPIVLALGIAMLGSADPLLGEIKVIANRSVSADSITRAELKQVYLEQTRLLGDGSHVEPVLERASATNATFLKDFLEINDDALQSYYRTLVFTGRGSMPKALGSDSEVVAYVLKTRGAIGYVNVSADADGVKILSIATEGRGSQRTLLTRVEPEYPETLKHLLIGGTVRLEITVSASGSVDTAEEVGGNPILVASAITAVKQWVYAAGRSRTKMEVSILFDPNQ
jgi:TonB family protein